ncbi:MULTISPECIES: ferredoxin-type protein NapF [unclassified Meridianimarinicoccus]|uniref:ferredoxin-type protein NapF n=1 Tax=unclassified Meridianimarinicoccus TaxID=2923344 RepID=UPI001866C276|nr:ferredoxin-type protein NapF [Fluviibacterium sp. MJW13]
MATATSRREFLRGRVGPDARTVMRPPGVSSAFLEACTRCADCITACPEGILVRDADNGPVVDFARGACTFCGQCAEACPTEALMPDRVAAWSWKARVADNCLSMNGVTCRSCQDSCEPAAISFRLALGGCSRPVVDLDQCTGCGGCAYSCPTGAIDFYHPEITNKEAAV